MSDRLQKMDIVRGVRIEMQERVGCGSLAALALPGPAGCWYVSPCFAAQLVPFKGKLKRNCKHTPRPAKRRTLRLDTSRNARPNAAKAARASLPVPLKEGKGMGDGGNTRPNGRENSGASPQVNKKKGREVGMAIRKSKMPSL